MVLIAVATWCVFAPALTVSEEEVTTDWIALQLLANTLLAEVHHDGHPSR